MATIIDWTKFGKTSDNEKKPYTFTPEERCIFEKILCVSSYSPLEFFKNDKGILFARTPQWTWHTLCGREWLVDLKNKTIELTSLN